MNGFLVLGRCSADDVPMRLFATRGEAWEFAREVDADDVRTSAELVSRVSVSDILAVAVVEFRDGVAVRVEKVKDLDDLDEELRKYGIG
jgi:hypothetical protein